MSKWDELWDETPFNFLSYSPTELVKVPDKIAVDKTWLHRIKAEGDRLKEKAKYYDLLKEENMIIEVPYETVTGMKPTVVQLNPQKIIEWREKAEKYNKIQESVPLIHHLTFEQFINEYKKLVEKVEEYDLIQSHIEQAGKALETNKKLEVIIGKVREWDLTYMRDNHAAPSILTDLEELLELHEEKYPCPCSEASRENCAVCQDVPVWYFDRPKF